MKKLKQAGLTISGVTIFFAICYIIIIFFVICYIIRLDAEQMGRAFAQIIIPVIAFALGLELWKKFKAKKKIN